MQTGLEFYTTIVKEGDSQYTVKKGSYIPLRESNTSNKLRKNLAKSHRKKEEGKIVWGEDVDPLTGYIKRDVKLNTKTQLANFVYGANELTYPVYSKNREGLPNVRYNYINFPEDEVSKKLRHAGKLYKDRVSELSTTYEGFILDDIYTKLSSKEQPTKKEQVELLLYWVSKKGGTYSEALHIAKHFKLCKTWYAMVEGLLDYNYMDREGMDESFTTHKYTGWKMGITVKGDARYKELVTQYIEPTKQAKYLDIGKLPYQDDLQPESLYDFYLRIKNNEGLGPLPIHNQGVILAVHNHYALNMSDLNEDINKVMAEEFDIRVVVLIKDQIEWVKDNCELEVHNTERGQSHIELNKLRVSLLTKIVQELDMTIKSLGEGH